MSGSNRWAPQVPLGEVVQHRKKFIEIDDLSTYKRCRVQLHAKGILLRDEVEGAAIKTKKQQVCRPDDFLVAEIDAKMGGFGIVPEQLNGAIVSSHYFLFEPIRDRLDPRFLGYYCRTPAFRDQVSARGTTNYAAIRPSHVLGYTIPLPPLEEQRRIVAKIERLAGKIEEAITESYHARKEAAALVAACLREQFASLPTIAPIDEIANVRGGIQKGPHRLPGNNPVRYLTVAHVQRNHILTDNPRYFEVSQEELERWRLLAGDVLIIEGNGSAEQIGRAALYRGEIEDCVHQNHVIRIRADKSLILPEFLNAFLNSPAGQDVVQKESRTTSGLRTLSVGRIKAIRVPTPPIRQQEKILTVVERWRNASEELDRTQFQVQLEINALLPSILDRAFRGDLGTSTSVPITAAPSANQQLAKRSMVYIVMLLRHWSAPVARNVFDACLALMLNDQARKKILSNKPFHASAATGKASSPLRGLDNLLGEMRVRQSVKVTTRNGQQFVALGQQSPSTDDAPAADKQRLEETIAAFEIVGEDRATDVLAGMIGTTYELATA